MMIPVESKQIRLIATLQDWADWQSRSPNDIGYPSGSAGFGRGSGVHSFEDMCDRSDNLIMSIVDAAIDDLPLPQQSALLHRYTAAVFRFARLSYVEQLDMAHDALIVSLPRKGVVL